MKIHDISIEINNETIVYPNNAPVEISDFAKMPEASSNLSKISFGSHTGTHIDAPKHTIEDGAGINIYPLQHFIGPAKVFDFSYLQPGQAIKIADFDRSEISVSVGDKILVKTSNSERGYNEFYTDFVYLDGDCADWLAEKGIALFGIDYLSIKQKGSNDNRAHNSLLSKNIPIVEGLNLKNILEGKYQLNCVPLKLGDIDGAPCRAILIEG